MLSDTVTQADARERYLAEGWWDDTTLSGRVSEVAATDPERPAVIDQAGERTSTYGRLDRDANRVAAYLASVGVQPGDVVAVQLPNWYETVAVDLGVMRAGAVLNPMLPVYRQRELRHMLSVGRTRVVFTPGEVHGTDHAAVIGGIRDDLPDLEHHVVVDGGHDPSAFGKWLADWPDDPPGHRPDAAAVSELMFTSGTEADPKAIMHTEQTAGFSARAAWAALGMSTADVVWMPSPIGHSTGLNYGVRIALSFGLPLVLQDRWNAGEAARLVARHRCTYTVAATTFLADLVDEALRGGADLSSLRLFSSGGAPVPAELVGAAEALGMTVLRLYGSTEVLVATWNTPESPRPLRLATDGRPLDHVEVEVRDDEGRPLVGEPGEIFVRGPNTSVGFFADPERTAGTFGPGGWVRSGDLGVLDEAGHLTIVGRRKEIIIRGGMNIAPREIEDVIRTMPEVGAVAVVGLPDARLGEITCACVVPAGTTVTLESVTAHLRAQGMATYKLPQRLVTVEALPTTSTGKVRKFELVQAILQEEGE